MKVKVLLLLAFSIALDGQRSTFLYRKEAEETISLVSVVLHWWT